MGPAGAPGLGRCGEILLAHVVVVVFFHLFPPPPIIISNTSCTHRNRAESGRAEEAHDERVLQTRIFLRT